MRELIACLAIVAVSITLGFALGIAFHRWDHDLVYWSGYFAGYDHAFNDLSRYVYAEVTSFFQNTHTTLL